MKNLIIDCETLGTRDNAIVPMFAAIVTDDELSIKDNLKNLIILHPSIEEQRQNGGTEEQATLYWWKSQSIDTFNTVMSQTNSLPLLECAKKFDSFLVEKGYSKNDNPFIWQRGSKDEDWLKNVFASCGNAYKLDWWSVRDIRTAIDVLGASSKQNGYMDADKVSDEGTMLLMKMNEKGKAHHPAYDVVRDFVFLRSLKLV